MIDVGEIERRARHLGLRSEHVWQDYVLNHILAAVVDAGTDLTFRGGTALARVYWPDFRLSEDLDFVTEASADSAQEVLSRAVERASRRTGFRLSLAFGTPKKDLSRSVVRWEDAGIVIDIGGREPPSIAPQPRKLDLPYSDLKDRDREVTVLTIEEILGNKWYMLDERDEPRDLFDIWSGLCQLEIPFGSLAVGHKAKHGFPPQVSQLKRARRLKDLWEMRLGHQVGDLPEFEGAYGAVRGKLDDWLRQEH